MVTDNWQAEASCKGASPDEIFAPVDAPASIKRRSALIVKERYCLRCGVRPQCLQFAIEHDECDGVWGGLNEEELAAEKRARARARRRIVLDVTEAVSPQ